MKKVRIYNETRRKMYVAIEPIGDAYLMNPNDVVELVGTFDLQDAEELGISVFDDTISVYCPDDTRVFHEGEEIFPTVD